MVKVEAVVVRERVETVIEAVEERDGPRRRHGRRGDRARARERDHARVPRPHVRVALPAQGATLTFVVHDALAERVAAAIVDAARTGHASGDGLCWTSPVTDVAHHRTGERLAMSVTISC